MAFSLLPREDEYFTLFSEISSKIQDAARLLVEMLEANEPDLIAYTRQIKDVEHACDELTHRVTTKLNKSFITPFDREDIYTLSVALDDICDYIDAGAGRPDVRHKNDNRARQTTCSCYRKVTELNSAVLLLKSPNGINAHFVEVHRLENEADDIYFRAIGELFKSSTDPIEIIKWKEVYEILEYATDRCESVANIIESIVLKHN